MLLYTVALLIDSNVLSCIDNMPDCDLVTTHHHLNEAVVFAKPSQPCFVVPTSYAYNKSVSGMHG